MKRRGIFTRRTISNMLVVAFGVLLFIALANVSTIRSYVGWFFGILSPFIIGIGMAYLLNLPMRFIEEKFYHKLKRKRLLSIITVYLLTIVVIAAIVGLLIPQVMQSLAALLGNLNGYITSINEFTEWLTATLGLDEDVLDFIALSYTDIVNQLLAWVQNMLPQLLDGVVKFGSSIVSVLTAFIASLYMLASKDKLLLQTRRVMYAALPKKRADEVYRVAGLSNQMFSGFVSGKLLDSLIIGIICYIFMFIMNLWVYEMPFAPLISLVIAITNIIPFFGPFIGAIPSIMILLLVNPWSALWFGIFVIVLQQFDGNILGPKILGDSTGLPALWVLIAIVVGGGLFGFMGMILGVPTVAVLYTLFSDVVEKRLKKKGMNRQAQPVEGPANEPDGPGEDKPGPFTAPDESMDADSGMD